MSDSSFDLAGRQVRHKVTIILLCLGLVIKFGRQEVATTSGISSRIKETNRAESSLEALSSTREPSSSSSYPCPPVDPAVEENFTDYPQQYRFGDYRNETGFPFLTQDFWFNAVDNRRTFFLRVPGKPKAVGAEQLLKWIQSRPHPISLVINNQQDKSWPEWVTGSRKFELYINETNLHRIYAGNARYLPEYAHKVHPIPLGLKFAYISNKLFGEPKDVRAESFARYGASSPEQSKEMFSWTNRTTTVYWRPMDYRSNKHTTHYRRDTPALSTVRGDIPAIVNKTAKKSMYFSPEKQMPQEEFFEELKKHRFVISPPGNGLDTHATWEAMLCGCIPIVPRSDLDRVFDDLPVWLVDSWDEITDASVKEKEEYFLGKTYKWEKLYQPYWQEKIYEGLCTV